MNVNTNFSPRSKGPFKMISKGSRVKYKNRNTRMKKESKTELLDREIKGLTEKYDQVDAAECKSFKDFPLCKLTLQGLEQSKYEKPTDIQRESLLLALKGHDILGAAKTGSGKTLAFLIPVLECLYRNKWSKLDGLGALIISPTRELAYQTFNILKRVGKFHNFSAGLVIGGKSLKEESGRMSQTNIVICTPGRLLQHMDETAYFTADSLQVLVLDEADRILDMGFQQSMNAIIENLPPERQTLLFSATQTRSIRDLARLSLKHPMYVSVHENSTKSTPNKLEQNYIVCELHEKINLLWSFLKNHLRSKILVFLSSCKQVKYITEAMNMLRPGIPLLCLHGGMPQLRRVAVYNQFLWKQHACLFATDIAARGLDFPAINWVIQLDCPEDANTYIHRAGRTARFEEDGESILILLPSEEEEMVKQLHDKKIPIEKINVNERRLFSIQHKMEGNCASDVNLKESAQRAFVAYMKSVFLMSNKKVFDVHALDAEAYARSLGLAVTPRLRFLNKVKKGQEEKKEKQKDQADVTKLKNKKSPVTTLQSDSDSESDNNDKKTEKDNLDSGPDISESGSSDSATENTSEKSEHPKFDIGDSGDELFSVRRNVTLDESSENEVDLDELRMKSKKFQRVKTRKQLAELLRKKKISINTKVKFDDEGEVEQDKLKNALGEDSNSSDEEAGGGIDIETVKKKMIKEDKVDKETYRQKIKRDHKEKRMKLKEERRKKREMRRMEQDDDEDEVEVKLPSNDEGSEDEGGADPFSFIPDPDKVYDRKQSNESDYERPSPAKRRKAAVETPQASSDETSDDYDDDDEGDSEDQRTDSNDEESDDSNYNYKSVDQRQSLKTDEEIALMLLHGKR